MSDTHPDLKLALWKQLAFVSVPLIVVLVLAEVAVRVTGAATHCANPYYQSGMWTCDPILYFKLKPSLVVNGKPLNAAGFRSREFTSKSPSILRVLSLGDSCTFGLFEGRTFGYIRVPYPQRLAQLVDQRLGPGRIEVFNAGIPGYSSFHGVMLLRSKLRGLRPDLITVRYGWNDHFVSHGDPNAFRETRNSLGRMVEDLLLKTQLYPFALRLGMELRQQREARLGHPTKARIPEEWRPTVPLEEYKQNLRRIVELGRAVGSRVWILTSPQGSVTDENTGREAGPNAWTANKVLMFNAIPSFERLVEIHESYNRASREVGRELSVPVVDMAEIYRDHASEQLFTDVDVCHPTQKGHDVEAEALYERLLAEGLLHQAP